MHTFTFVTPGKVVCGAGAAYDGRLTTEVALLGKRPLLICGKSLATSGRLERIAASLPGARVHIGVPPEPSLADCVAAQQSVGSADVIVAIGGGSVLDVAKAAALPGDIYDYFDGALPVPDTEALPVVAVPTTAGTGSEATWVGVYTDKRGSSPKKASIRGGAMLPKTVVLDAALSVSCPQNVTAASGMDAFVQAVEAYVSRGANPFTDPLALNAAFDIAEWLPVAFRDGESLEARECLLIASYQAGMALNTARLGLVHGIAHPVGARTGAAHGALCALLLPAVIRFNTGADLDRYSDLAISLGAPGENLAAFVEQWLDDFNLPRRLSDLGLERAELPAVIAETLVSGSTKANPRTVEASDVQDVLDACW